MPRNPPKKRTWPAKFGHALRGIRLGSRGQSSFYVHAVAALLVVAAGLFLRVNRTEWCLLLLCIVIVLAAEMFNSALERLAKAVTEEYDERIGAALDIASAAVLISALGTAIVGAIIFLNRAVGMFG